MGGVGVILYQNALKPDPALEYRSKLFWGKLNGLIAENSLYGIWFIGFMIQDGQAGLRNF